VKNFSSSSNAQSGFFIVALAIIVKINKPIMKIKKS